MNPDLDAPVRKAQQNTQAMGGMFGEQRGETGNFLSRYSGAIASQPTTSAMADRIGKELNLPALRQNANMLNTTMRELPNTYNAATRGFDVNANQLSRIIGKKSSDLAPALATANDAVNSAENTLNTRLGYETRDQDRALLPFQSEQNLMSERFARETTGYTNAMESELDAIVQKMNAGIQISEAEKSRAHALALQEAGFQQQLKVLKEQSSQPNFVGVQGGLYNTTSGSWAVAPEAKAPVGTFNTGWGTTPTPTKSSWSVLPSGAMTTNQKVNQAFPSYFTPLK